MATPEGPITYRLVKKRVKNLNLRLDRTGEVVLSVPLRCPAERADAFVIEKSGWIVGPLPRPEEAPPLMPEPDRRECARLLEEAGVAAAGGTSFGAFGEGYIRFSYANSLDNIKIAVSRLEKFVKTLK